MEKNDVNENSIKESEKKDKTKRNHWTSTNIDNATKKINQEIYERSRQAPIHIKLDDLAIFINDKIKRRGIAKGLVSVQEDLNIHILEVEKLTVEALLEINKKKQYDILSKTKNIMKIEIWTDIRFLMINKAITPGEITELIRRQVEINKDIDKWLASINQAIPADR